MPYSLKGNCVIKSDTGTTVKCHDTHEQALAHLRALEANVTDAKETKAFTGKLEPEAVNYIPLSTTKGKACANCQWFMNDGCWIVDSSDPDDQPIIATGYCDRWESPPPPEDPMEELTEVISDAIENMGAAVGVAVTDAMPTMPVMDMSKELFATPSDSLFTTLQKRLRREPLKPSTRVLKDNAGRRYMFMVTSNGYKDGDGDHVATKALQEYVDNAWLKGDVSFVGDNDHFIWHTRELGSVSDLMFADVWSGFLVELWREKSSDPIAKGFYNFVERHTEIEWGASHGFFSDREDGVFKHIDKVESSTLPLLAASNLLTLSEVLPMVEKGKRDTFLNTLFKEEFGIEDAASLLKQGPEKLRAELQARGIEAKALGEGSDALKKAKTENMKQTADVLLSMVEVQDEMDRELETIKSDHTKALETKDAQIKALETKFDTETKAWQTELDKVLAIVNAPPRRPSQDTATVVKEGDNLQSVTPGDDPASKVASFLGAKVKPVGVN